MKFPQKNNRAAKLAPTDVLSIRRKYESGAWSQGQLARDYGVSLNTIGKIVRYEAWHDLVPPASAEGLAEMAQRMLKVQESTDALSRVEQAIAEKDPLGPTFAAEALKELSPGAAQLFHQLTSAQTPKGEGNERGPEEVAGRDASSDQPAQGGGGAGEPDPGYPTDSDR
jgi:hypothetical protein